MPFELAGAALEKVRPYVVWGPEHHVDHEWDLTFLKADFRGQRVEPGDTSSDPRFFDEGAGRWVPQRIDCGASARASNCSGCGRG